MTRFSLAILIIFWATALGYSQQQNADNGPDRNKDCCGEAMNLWSWEDSKHQWRYVLRIDSCWLPSKEQIESESISYEELKSRILKLPKGTKLYWSYLYEIPHETNMDIKEIKSMCEDGNIIFISEPNTASVSAVNLGKRITVEGWAVSRKNGAQLVGTDFDLWIDGLHSWPEGYYSGGDKGKKVRVSGVLAKDNDLPVFFPKNFEFSFQGIPIPDETDLEKASHRYLLKNAKWELTE